MTKVGFDHAEIPGLLSIDGCVWIGDRSSATVAALILKRLQGIPLAARPLVQASPE